MSARYAVFIEGLEALDDLVDISPEIERKAIQAINKTTRRTRTEASRQIRNQIRLKASYLNQEDRLSMKFARAGKLEGRISGRDRPTSLARFVTNKSGSVRDMNRRFRRSGARIQVKPGATRVARKAFAVPLRGGNVGLAIRTKGGPPQRAYKPKKLSDNVYLLYGPSIDQVFSTVREDLEDDAAEFLEYEFNRLLDLGGKV